MPITRHELGKRLRAARETLNLTQEQVAQHLGVPRSAVAQMELGNRAVASLELERLAYFFGRDLRDLLSDQFDQRDPLSALFRAAPALADQEPLVDALRLSVAVGREMTNLERVLEVDRRTGSTVSYPVAPPQSKWDAIQQGDRIAIEERQRLGLGWAPLPRIAALMESQGVRTAEVSLPDDISGLTVHHADVGVFVVVNADQPAVRHRFSYAHEYAHVLLDRASSTTVSRRADRASFVEVRANAFAASFLMPARGFEEYLRGLGKGSSSRSQVDVWDEADVLRIEGREEPGSQSLQLYDIVQAAHHFGVSRQAAIYRARNLRLIREAELDELLEEDEAGLGTYFEELLGIAAERSLDERNHFRHRFLGLALEAIRRDAISMAKLLELGEMVNCSREELAESFDQAGLRRKGGAGGDSPAPGPG